MMQRTSRSRPAVDVGDSANATTWVELWTTDDLAAETPRPARPVALIATLLALFGILTVAAVVHHGPIAGDSWIGADLLRHRGESGWQIADIVSFGASGPIVALVALMAAAWLTISRRQLASGLAVLAAPAVGGAVEVAMKMLVGRPRPVSAALAGESGNGFPSGHVTGFAALAVSLLVVLVLDATNDRSMRRAWTATTVLSIVLVMWSRVALGAHYVSDTVGGALLGAAVGFAVGPVIAGAGHLLQRGRPTPEHPDADEFGT